MRIGISEQDTVFDEIKRTEIGKEMLLESSASFSGEAMKVFTQSVKGADKFLQLQTMLDAYSYVMIDKALSIPNKDVARIRDVFRKEVDARNVIIIERLKLHNVEKSKIKGYLIKGGSLKDFAIEQLIEAKDLSRVVGIARNKFPKLQIVEKDFTLAQLEVALEKAIAAEKIKGFERSILSIGVLLGFLLLKEEELNNIRKIAKAKEFGISEQETREMLVVV